MAKQKRKTEKYNELYDEYKKLAKRADQRLVRIEQHAEAGDIYAGMINFAYRRAMVDIRKWSGENARRFNVKAPASTISLKAKIRDIKEFLESPSSSVKPTKDNLRKNKKGEVVAGGVQLTYDKRAKTLNERYGQYLDSPFTWENIQEFFESSLWKKMDKRFADSKTTLRAIGTIRKNKQQVAEEIAAHKPSHINVDDAIIDKRINHLLRYYKKDINKLFD